MGVVIDLFFVWSLFGCRKELIKFCFFWVVRDLIVFFLLGELIKMFEGLFFYW